jgi:hypothetical protein
MLYGGVEIPDGWPAAAGYAGTVANAQVRLAYGKPVLVFIFTPWAGGLFRVRIDLARVAAVCERACANSQGFARSGPVWARPEKNPSR